jgi:hypothetical protein
MASQNNGFEEHGVTLSSQGRVIWSSNSKDHPRNWGLWSKTYTVIVVTWLEAYMTAISTAGVSNRNCIPDHDRADHRADCNIQRSK